MLDHLVSLMNLNEKDYDWRHEKLHIRGNGIDRIKHGVYHRESAVCGFPKQNHRSLFTGDTGMVTCISCLCRKLVSLINAWIKNLFGDRIGSEKEEQRVAQRIR